MASNQYVNKVEYDGTTLIDITDTTAEAADVASGAVFYAANGARSTGAASYAGAAIHNGAANKTAAIPYAQVDSTSTATLYTATVDGISSLYDGVCVLLKNGVVTSASGFKVNINGLGAKPVYSNMAAATAETTIFNINYTLLLVYDSTRVSGGCWINYRGYDANTNTVGYQLRTNSAIRKAADTGYPYRLWFAGLDGKTWVPANTSTSTNATAARTPNTRAIDPFGEVIYNSTNATVNANANLPTTSCWSQYTISLGYSFNKTGAALSLTYPAPVYLKCTPQETGGVVITDYVQSLPGAADGYVYMFLGMAYSATEIELFPYHPVYYYHDGAVRQWTNANFQEKLVSGTNIKTVNDTSLLGSGDISVQPTLVSGTNIKTVNSTSLLGSGNVSVQPTLVSGTNIKTVNNTSLLGSGNVNIKAVNGTVTRKTGTKSLGSGSTTNVASFSLAAGTYWISVDFKFESGTGGRRFGCVTKTSGSSTPITEEFGVAVAPVSGATTSVIITGPLVVTATTTYYLSAYQNSGSTKDVDWVYNILRIL